MEKHLKHRTLNIQGAVELSALILRCIWCWNSSENLDMDWEKFTARVDVLEGCRATTMPAEGDRPALTNIFTGALLKHTRRKSLVRYCSAAGGTWL